MFYAFFIYYIVINLNTLENIQGLPLALINSLEKIASFDKAAFIEAHKTVKNITSIRVNEAKTTNHPPPTANVEKVPWTVSGSYLPARPSFTLDPTFHAGAYYVHEASSMFLEQALRQSVDLCQPLKVLDLCAAPGGKSTHIQSLISADSLLVSNDVIKSRASILSENLTKWGAANVVVTNNDPKDFQRLENFFDVVVVDAPCSGSGLFRKDPDAINEWSQDNVALCSQRQQRILADIWPALKPNGILVYSTCSYSVEEDENIATWLKEELTADNVKLAIAPDWGIVETNTDGNFGYRFYPDKVKGEGFFLACFKKAAADFYQPEENKNRRIKLDKNAIAVLEQWVDKDLPLVFVAEKEEWLAMPATVAEALDALKKNCYIRKAGVRMGKVIRNELIPDHELAVSTIIAKTIPFVALDEASALQYLRKKDVQLDTDKTGWLLVKYHGYGLGWIKAMANRTNNYYPSNWRILK